MSARDIASALMAAFGSPVVRPVVLVWLDFDDQPAFLWSGVGPLSWDGETWQGTGAIGRIGRIEETARIRAAGATLELSGVPSELISIALAEPYQGREARIWLGAFDEAGDLIASPYPLFRGRMDVMAGVDTGDTATLTLTVENRLVDLERPRVRRRTDADHQQMWPGDRFFEYVTDIQTKPLFWGRREGHN